MGEKAVSTEIKQLIIGLDIGGFKPSEIARTLKSISQSYLQAEHYRNLS